MIIKLPLSENLDIEITNSLELTFISFDYRGIMKLTPEELDTMLEFLAMNEKMLTSLLSERKNNGSSK